MITHGLNVDNFQEVKSSLLTNGSV